MNRFLRDTLLLLDHGEPLVLVTVVSHDGSTPRSSGAKMAVRAGGGILGTVGGGLLEAQAMDRARQLLREPAGTVTFLDIELSNELAANSDMICGGRLTLFLEHLAPGGSCAQALAQVQTLLKRGGRALLRTSFSGEPSRAVRHEVQDGSCAVQGATLAGDQTIQTPSRDSRDFACAAPRLLRDGHGGQLLELFRPAPPLFVLGAGHVSQPTASMAAMVGFRTVVLDDRSEFANVERFPEADEVVVLPDFSDAFAGRIPTEDACIVIVTRGHLHDRTVLAQALRTRAGYVGMIGSRKKRDAIYQSLLADGFTQQDIDRCRCPIGLAIGAQTPAEIAVSIVAELVQCRAKGQN